MAQKRALVAATLIACNASEFFTQDVEDGGFIGDYIPGEWKDAEHSQPEPEVKKSKPEPKPASVSIEDQLKALPELPLFDAEEMTNSEGKKYADIETETLGYMRKSILEALGKNHLEEAQKQTYLNIPATS